MTESTDLLLQAEVNPFSFVGNRFLQLAMRRDYWHLRGVRWSTDLEEPPLGDEAIVSIRYANREGGQVVLEADDALIQIEIDHGTVTARVAGRERIDVQAAISWLRELIPEPEDREQEAKVEFWWWGRGAPESIERRLRVPAWDELRDNYAPEASAALDDLVDWRPATEGGRLLLWHGPPGTGKTHALRALAWQWRDWCDLHYITDPEVFFGERPGYMLQLLTSNADEDDRRERWRMLVLEDTGELMRVDAKERVGQGLSRLLNLVDGLIGQGFPILVLVTTNEPLERLHAAVSRPGRCAWNVEFGPLHREAARRWLEHHGSDAEPGGAVTLAELYAVLAGDEIVPARSPVGFANAA